jgi:hypothetical protein
MEEAKKTKRAAEFDQKFTGLATWLFPFGFRLMHENGDELVFRNKEINSLGYLLLAGIKFTGEFRFKHIFDDPYPDSITIYFQLMYPASLDELKILITRNWGFFQYYNPTEMQQRSGP